MSKPHFRTRPSTLESGFSSRMLRNRSREAAHPRPTQHPNGTHDSSQTASLFPSLEILRGFAAISVVVYHVIAHFSWTDFPTTLPLSWFRAGELSVDLFFVISGLVITSSLLRSIDRNPSTFARIYFERRFARIVPLHYLTCAAYVALVVPVLVTTPDFPLNVARYLTFTHNLSTTSFGLINGANWSLGVEMQFYLLLLLATPLLRRARPLSVLLSLITVSWVYRAAMVALFHDQKSGWIDLAWFANNQLPAVLDEFAFGIALALFLHHDRSGRFLRILTAFRWLWPILAATLVVFTLDLYFKNGSYWSSTEMIIFYRTLLGACWLALVLSACALNDPWFIRCTTPLRYLGTISYGIYLWHSLVIALLKPHFTGSPGLALLLTLTGTIALAALSWHLFESPILDRMRKPQSPPPHPTPNRLPPPHHLP